MRKESEIRERLNGLLFILKGISSGEFTGYNYKKLRIYREVEFLEWVLDIKEKKEKPRR